MTWDELCILSGIRPGGGPVLCTSLSGAFEGEAAFLLRTAEAVRVRKEIPLTTEEVANIIKDAIDCLDGDGSEKWDQLCDVEGRRAFYRMCLAIGTFSDDPDNIFTQVVARPEDVVVRRVAQSQECGDFIGIVSATGEDIAEQSEVRTFCQLGGDNWPNFFVINACFQYLRAWLSPSSGHPQDETALAQELYEIVNYRTMKRSGFPISCALVSFSDLLYFISTSWSS